MPSRKIEDLLPEAQDRAEKFSAKMIEAGLRFIFTCTYRSQEEQDALYAQGREPLEVVNTMRTKLGLWLLKEDENRIVTKAKVSKHTSRKAFDIAIVRDGRADYNLKVNVNDNEIPDYIEAGKIGQSVGLRWGGDWNGDGRSDDERFLDLPHYELVA